MRLFWRIRYLDRTDKRFKDRDLYLETRSLPPVERAAIELLVETEHGTNDRSILRFRSNFKERISAGLVDGTQEAPLIRKSVFVRDYLEDETGREIRPNELGPLLTGDPTSIIVSGRGSKHDLEFQLSTPQPFPIAEVSLSEEQILQFGYFLRDVTELQESALFRERPGEISTGGSLPVLPNDDVHLTTSVTDDEIRSAITIFRRLYMKSEPANFLKTVNLFSEKLGEHPLAKWVAGECCEYRTHLCNPPEPCPFAGNATLAFSVKRLIDVFLYTQYAHQPDPRRQRQFNECLQQVGGKRNYLTFLLLSEVWNRSLEIVNAGRAIDRWFTKYCQHHGITPDILNSLRLEHPGLGKAEKEEDRKARLFREKVEELEMELWKQADRPAGGPVQFRLMAEAQLRRALNGTEESA